MVSTGNSLDGTTLSELVTHQINNISTMLTGAECQKPCTRMTFTCGVVKFQTLIESLSYLLLSLQHFNWDCHAPLLPFFFNYDFCVFLSTALTHIRTGDVKRGSVSVHRAPVTNHMCSEFPSCLQKISPSLQISACAVIRRDT